MRNLRYIYQIVTHLCLYPQGDLAFEKMTFNSGNLWQVKCSICWTQCETQESWVRQLHPHSVMYFFMTSVQHFLLPCRACFSELFRRINGHKYVLTRKHVKSSSDSKTLLNQCMVLPCQGFLSYHITENCQRDLFLCIDCWQCLIFMRMSMKISFSSCPPSFFMFVILSGEGSLYLLASIFFWFKMKTAVNNLFSCFLIDKDSLEKEVGKIIMTVNSQTEYIDK